MSNMVERVANVLNGDFAAARAAIAAMREPSEEMLDAGEPHLMEGWSTYKLWQAMIDEALKT